MQPASLPPLMPPTLCPGTAVCTYHAACFPPSLDAPDSVPWYGCLHIQQLPSVDARNIFFLCFALAAVQDGTNYRMEVESRQQSRQLYVVSQSSGSRDEFGMWPVAKRLTLEHIEEGPLPLAVEQSDPEAEPFGDAPMLPPSSAAKVQAGAADEGLTSKETPGKDEAKSAKKEKKEKKDKKDRKDKKSRESR
eukprot:363645-Chlamydomonas_euryale.AAC.5